MQSLAFGSLCLALLHVRIPCETQGTADVGTDLEENLRKARSLGNALLVFTVVPWSLCAFFFSGLHWTYPRDRDRARAQQLGQWPEAGLEERQRLTHSEGAPLRLPGAANGGGIELATRGGGATNGSS